MRGVGHVDNDRISHFKLAINNDDIISTMYWIFYMLYTNSTSCRPTYEEKQIFIRDCMHFGFTHRETNARPEISKIKNSNLFMYK